MTDKEIKEKMDKTREKLVGVIIELTRYGADVIKTNPPYTKFKIVKAGRDITTDMYHFRLLNIVNNKTIDVPCLDSASFFQNFKIVYMDF